MKKIGFLGAGNMGGALARAAAKCGKFEIILSDKDKAKATFLSEEIGAMVGDIDALSECDVVFLGVKPNVIPSAISEIKDIIKSEALVVSMAAATDIKKIEECFGRDVKVIRIMPNTPCAVGEGMILYAANKAACEDVGLFLEVMADAGRCDALDERLIDAAACISGCGPAFVYMFAEALADGGVACGLPREKAILYAAKTLKGAAEVILSTDRHPEELKDAVCSPGGTTIEGVHALESGAFRATAQNAVIAAFKKTLLMKK